MSYEVIKIAADKLTYREKMKLAHPSSTVIHRISSILHT
jgi:hypothetical protein